MKLKISALLVTLVALTQMILTLGCGSSKTAITTTAIDPILGTTNIAGTDTKITVLTMPLKIRMPFSILQPKQ